MSLHVFGHKTDFSLGESIIRPKELMKAAKDKQLQTIAVADNTSINALADLTSLGRELEVRPIVGTSIDVVDDLAWRRPKKGEKRTKNLFWRTSLYPKNEQGFKDIMLLLTVANGEDNFYIKPQICLEDLIYTVKQGNVLCSLGSSHSVFEHKASADIVEELEAHCSASDLFVELVPVDSIYYDRINIKALETMRKYNLRAVFSRPSLHIGQAPLRNTIESVIGNKLRNHIFRREPEPTLEVLSQREFMDHIKSMCIRMKAENADYVSMIKGAIATQKEIVGELNFNWEPYDPCLPDLASDPFQTLRKLCVEGWKKRIGNEVLGYKPKAEDLDKYKQRLAYELGIIKSMGFSNYFLLVESLIEWCKEEGVFVGPGRGSVGGSLIAFLVGITDVDPIRFDLIFERFINPDRLDLPDIDLDFMSSRRQEIIEHLIDRYGRDRVAGISNYNLLGPASSLRFVAKAHGLHENSYSCSKLIPKIHGNSLSLAESIEEVPEIEAFATTNPEIWSEADAAQGRFKNYGKHAAGIVVAGEPIENRAVLERRGDEPIINWDKNTVEKFGLIKLDILGLTTLDVLAIAKGIIKKEHKKDIQYETIPLDDRKVMEGFEKGDTVGVFQFESGGMRQLLKNLSEEEPLTFDDITAATALYRPGPMESGLMEDFVDIKRGDREPFYLHENMVESLESTYGVIVYQEQVMSIARDLAGFTMAESDHLRKAMGKKKPEEMAKYRDKWVEGCVEHSGITEKQAGKLFDQIEAFAGYAFNKSHSVEYTIISYWAMWLKTYYPEVFYAASMSVLDSLKLAKDAEKKEIYVVPPDINKSSDRFEIGYDSKRAQKILYAPFQMINGLSANGAKAILRAKEKMGRPFTSKKEFVDTVERRLCNIRVQEKLDLIGAFAEIEGQIDARHPDRLKDQKQLMPSIMTASVRADRKIEMTNLVKDELKDMVATMRDCDKCTLAGECHPTPRAGRSAKIMLVMDCPNWSEGDALKMGEGQACDPLKEALTKAGIGLQHVYITSLVKAPKPKGETLANEMINGCADYLKREIELLKPPIIVALGGKAARHLDGDLKGGWEEICGEEKYLPKIDSTLIVGMNPMMIGFDPTKQKYLDEVIARAAELIS